MHIVMGASGAVGSATLNALLEAGLPAKGIGRAEADARDPAALTNALSGASHIYFCVGLPYDRNVWREGFPRMASALVKACKATTARLIFLDNVYMYGPKPLPVPFDENTAFDPPSVKGHVRKETTEILLKAHEKGDIQLTIGRAADFYGPGAINSVLYTGFLENMLAGKAPQLVIPEGPVHTYAFTPDLGRALAALGQDAGTMGETFHLPVGKPVRVSDLVETMNAKLRLSVRASHMTPFMLRLLSLFVPILKEVREMNYQFEADYIMDDQKFLQRYPDFEKTSYSDGIAQTIEFFRKA